MVLVMSPSLRCAGPARASAFAIPRWRFANATSGRVDITGRTNKPNQLPIGMALSVLDAEPDLRLWVRSLLDADPITRGYCMVGDGGRTEGEDEGCRDVESGNMKSMSAFGLLVTGEIDCDNLTPGRTNEAKTNVVDKVFNPGLVHLLLLRGRMGAH